MSRYISTIQISSQSWKKRALKIVKETCAEEGILDPKVLFDIKICPGVVNSLGTPRSTERPDHICTTIQSDEVTPSREQISTTIESDGAIQGVDRQMRPAA